MRVAVILLTLNQRRNTRRCLESLRGAVGADDRIVVWDNGSQDGTAETIRADFPGVLVHREERNLGVASGRNAAAALALESWNPRYLFFMDNDMMVAPGFLEALTAPFADDERLAQTTGKIIDLNDRARIFGAGGCRIRFWIGDTGHVGHGEIDRGQFDKGGDCIPSGGCMLVRSEVFKKLGGFDGAFDPYGPEDLDFGLRVRDAGFHRLYVPQAVVYHESEPSQTFEAGSYTERYAANKAKHWFRFMGRHATLTQKAGFLFVGAPFLLLKLALREGRKGNLLPALRGVVGGWIRSAKPARDPEQ